MNRKIYLDLLVSHFQFLNFNENIFKEETIKKQREKVINNSVVSYQGILNFEKLLVGRKS